MRAAGTRLVQFGKLKTTRVLNTESTALWTLERQKAAPAPRRRKYPLSFLNFALSIHNRNYESH